MYSQDRQDDQDHLRHMERSEESAEDTRAANQDAMDTRPTFDPGGRVIDAPEGAPRDPQNNGAELPDGRSVEVPPSNLAAAKELLAAQKAAEGLTAGQGQVDQQNQLNQSEYPDR